MTTAELLEKMISGEWPEDAELRTHDEGVTQRAKNWLDARTESDMVLLTVKLDAATGALTCNSYLDGSKVEQVLVGLPELVILVSELDAASLRGQFNQLRPFSDHLTYPAILLNEVRMEFPEPKGVRLVWLRPIKYQLETHGKCWCMWASHFHLRMRV